jgi:hypothetical protein
LEQEDNLLLRVAVHDQFVIQEQLVCPDAGLHLLHVRHVAGADHARSCPEPPGRVRVEQTSQKRVDRLIGERGMLLVRPARSVGAALEDAAPRPVVLLDLPTEDAVRLLVLAEAVHAVTHDRLGLAGQRLLLDRNVGHYAPCALDMSFGESLPWSACWCSFSP